MSEGHPASNQKARRAAAIYKELRPRGLDAQRALLPVLRDPDPGVRCWAAIDSLEFATDEAVPVLEYLVPFGVPIGLSAEIALKRWRSGDPDFPWPRDMR